MIIESRAVAPFMKNGFVVACADTREAVVIDPGDEVGGLLTFIEQQGLTVRHILLTHAHVDHIGGRRHLRSRPLGGATARQSRSGGE